MTRALRLAAAVVVLAQVACAFRVAPGITEDVDLAPGDTDVVRVVYLGTGGWIFERGGEQVLGAPLFSNPGLFHTGLLPIEADTAEIDRHMSKYDVSSAEAILVGHAHYDHLMDVPRVATHHARNARILGNRTVANTLGTWAGVENRIDVVNDSAATEVTSGKWMYYGRAIRVLPLWTVHAPHFDGMTLYKGTTDRMRTTPPRWATEWLDGVSHSYLVDFLDQDGSVAFRIYVQDAVSAPPAGFAPESLIAEHPVDLAIFVPATFDQVDWHPEAFVENLQPKHVLLGHWEDFFSPIDNETRSILLTDLGHFEGRLERVFDGPWWRPDLWTEFRFPVGR